MFKDYKYSVISKMHITLFFRYLLLSTSNIRMSEGTFCRIEVHIKVGYAFQGHFFLMTDFLISIFVAVTAQNQEFKNTTT